MRPPSEQRRPGFLATRLRSQDGQSLVILTLMMTTFIMFLALALDAGFIYSQRRMAQRAADAAVQAGAIALKNRGESQAITDAYRYAAENGFDNDGTHNWVTINLPPVSPPASQAYDYNYVQAIVTKTFSSFFAPIMDLLNFRVSATAVAYAGQVNNYVLFALNQTAAEAMEIEPNTQVHVTGGSIMVDSNSSTALSNGGVITCTNRIDVVGNYTLGGTYSPLPVSGARYVSDPLSGTPKPLWDSTANKFKLPPDYGTYSQVITHQQGSNTVGTATSPDLYQPSPGTTLSPGTYFGGIKITATGVYTFSPGIYIIAGRGLNLLGGATITANGVTFYNTNDPASPTGDGAYGSIAMGGGAGTSIVAPDTGVYRGLLIFQDPANTQTFSMAGGSGLVADGTIYAPTATASLGGGGGAAFTANAQFIVDKLELSGGNTINMVLNRRYDPPGFSLVE